MRMRSFWAILVLFFATTVFASTITVSSGGSIQTAVNQAVAGDEVVVEAGTYGPFSIGVSGSASAPITVRAQSVWQTIVVGPAGAGEAGGPAILITGSYIVLDGFEVKDSAGSGIRNGGDYVTIRRNYVHDNAARCDPGTVPKCGQGIVSNSSGHNAGVIIERNFSAYNGSGGNAEDHNYYLHGPGMIVRNNISVGSDDFGFQIYPDCDDCLIYNNVAYGDTRSGFLIGGDDSDGLYSSNVKIYNNIAVNSGQFGFTFYQPGNQPMTMRNNVAFNNASGALYVPAGFTNLDNANLLEVDPLWADPANLDFHLQDTSPAIDAGDDTYTPEDDMDGDTRIVGNAVDIGTDEYTTSGSTPGGVPTTPGSPSASANSSGSGCAAKSDSDLNVMWLALAGLCLGIFRTRPKRFNQTR